MRAFWFLLALVPLVLPHSYLTPYVLFAIGGLVALSLYLLTGLAGMTSFGQAAFMGVGAYTAALLAPNLPFWLVLPLGGLGAGLLGVVVGLPSLRVKHLYLALTTLAFQVIFEWSVGHLPLWRQGGAMEMPRASFLGLEAGYRNHYHFWYYVAFTTLVLMALAWRNLLRTKWGRALIAVRDNDRAADAMGMDPGRTKLLAFFLGAFYGGVAGGIYAYFARAVVIEDYTLTVSIKLLAMAIVGGLGTLVGSFLGPAFMELLDVNMEVFSGLLKAWGLGGAGVDVATAMRPLAFGLIIVLFLMFEPRGLYNWWRLVRSYFRTWPFKY
ncbi:MAG: branched-chain amino acid ABC transporter permease [Thermus sp.]